MSDIYHDHESEEDSEMEPSVQQEGSEPSSLKASQKHKYSRSIREHGADDLNNSMECSNNRPQLDKKERNKASAKQCRDRKKLYIQILEEKQRTLTKQLESRKKELEETRGYLQRVVNQNKTMSGFTASRHQMMKKIEGLLERAKNGEDPSEEINSVIDSLRYKIGATGRQRRNTINQYFKQIVNLSLPALHRYMMWSAAEGKHLFSNAESEEGEDEWFLELKKALNLTPQQKQEIQSKQQFLKEQKQLLQRLIGELRSIKNDIEEKSTELEDMIDGIREILTPLQAAHFILFIEKNKYRKELNLCEASLEEEGQPRKLTKTDQS